MDPDLKFILDFINETLNS